eukprot:GHVS01045030.1.p1 GENE.GHVS01045030.1~~GHVS01045030.1.p1  ORF type:complete len:220 (-),score=38.31 GHVS01045030.1:34-693(-)
MYVDLYKLTSCDTNNNNEQLVANIHNNNNAEQFFNRSCVCLILASGTTSPAKFNALYVSLFQDNTQVKSPLYEIMSKLQASMFINQIDTDTITDNLETYQQRLLSDGVLCKHIMQHNLISASLIYEDATFVTLSSLTGGTTPEFVEHTAAQMIRADALDARIDQMSSRLIFLPQNKQQQQRGATTAVADRWNADIRCFCDQLDIAAANTLRHNTKLPLK